MAKKNIYEEYIYSINNLIKQGELYPQYSSDILLGKNSYLISQIYTSKKYDTEWIKKIEECVTALDTIVRNPRKFIVIEEDIVDISLARSVSVESVKHLAQHTNLISSVKNGEVIPNKILNTSKEESYEIYENRFIYTLLLKTKEFIEVRYEKIKSALSMSGDLSVEVSSDYQIEGKKMRYKLESFANMPFEEAVASKKKGHIGNLERIVRIKNIFSDFLSSSFAREMRSSALVRPPITRTNVILKDPNFKKALNLWQFIVSNENMAFQVETEKETAEMPPAIAERYRGMIFLNTVLMQSIAESRSFGDTIASMTEEQKKYADEYISKNIDDFVPDDFPELKMDLNEVRRIYYKVPGVKSLKLAEIAKMNAAIDRVLRQHAINKAKEDSILKERLIKQQIKAGEEAKRLALKAAAAAERQRIKEEKEAEALAKRKAREQLLAEKRAERERIEHEKRLRAEALAAEKAIQEEAARAIAEEEKRLAEERERELREAAEREKTEQEARLREEAERAARELIEERVAHWEKERDLAIRLLTEKHTEALTASQKETLKLLKEREEMLGGAIDKIKDILSRVLEAQNAQTIERFMKEAETFHDPDDIITIAAERERGVTPYWRKSAELKLEEIKTRMELLKLKRRDKNK